MMMKDALRPWNSSKFRMISSRRTDYLALVGDAARLSWPERLGCEVIGRCPCEVYPSRIYPNGLARMARERGQRGRPGRYSLSRARTGTALSRARHAPNRYKSLRRRGRVTLERL